MIYMAPIYFQKPPTKYGLPTNQVGLRLLDQAKSEFIIAALIMHAHKITRIVTCFRAESRRTRDTSTSHLSIRISHLI